MDEDSVQVDDESVCRDEESVHADEVSVYADEKPIQPDEEPACLDEESVRVDEEFVRVDEEPVRTDGDSVDVDKESVRINGGLVRTNEESVHPDSESIHLDGEPVRTNREGVHARGNIASVARVDPVMRAVRIFGCVLLAAAAQGAAQEDPRRAELFRLVNAERAKAGVPPLRSSAPLTQAAEEHAAEISERGSLRLPGDSTDAMRQRLKRAGYEAHSWTESLIAATGDAETVLREWRQGNSRGFRDILAPEIRDLGIGIDRIEGIPLYIFLFAVPQADHFERGTAGIRDLEKVRAEMLARVNDARRKVGIAPLKPNAALDRAAQHHAEDMLGRGYFAHESPEGKTVRERARSAGYNWRTIGENVAENQFSVDEVMDTWLRSPGHRRNILNPDFKELGIGLARGRSGSAYRVLWAQAFGAR